MIFNPSVGEGLYQSVCVCMLPHNVGEYFVLHLVEPIAGKNASPSDKQLWQYLKNFLVLEKW